MSDFKSEGQRLLVQSLSERGAAVRLAKNMGVDSSFVSRWTSGRQKPVTRYRLMIEEIHGIDLLAWDEPAKAEADA